MAAAASTFLALSDLLNARASGRNASIAFTVMALFYVITLPLVAFVFPAGNSLVSLDDPAFLAAHEIIEIVDGWGDSGRKYQLWFHLTWDFVAPILGFLFLGLGFSWLFQRAFRPDSGWQRLNLLALVPVFDIFENVCLIWLIMDHPTDAIGVAWLKTVLTTLKFVSIVPLVLAVGIGLVGAVRNEFRVQ